MFSRSIERGWVQYPAREDSGMDRTGNYLDSESAKTDNVRLRSLLDRPVVAVTLGWANNIIVENRDFKRLFLVTSGNQQSQYSQYSTDDYVSDFKKKSTC